MCQNGNIVGKDERVENAVRNNNGKYIGDSNPIKQNMLHTHIHTHTHNQLELHINIFVVVISCFMLC